MTADLVAAMKEQTKALRALAAAKAKVAKELARKAAAEKDRKAAAAKSAAKKEARRVAEAKAEAEREANKARIIERAKAAQAAADTAKGEAIIGANTKCRMDALVRVAREFAKDSPSYDGPPIVVDLQSVIEWAEARGIVVRTWEDLPAVNLRREERGLVQFARAFPIRGVRRA